MLIPENIQKLLAKNKILEETDTAFDHVWWFKDPELYEAPERINESAPNFYLHLGKRGPHLLQFIK